MLQKSSGVCPRHTGPTTPPAVCSLGKKRRLGLIRETGNRDRGTQKLLGLFEEENSRITFLKEDCVWLEKGRTASNQGNAHRFEKKFTELSPHIFPHAWCIVHMAQALSVSEAGDSRKAGSHQASTDTGTCRGGQSPEEELTTFPNWAVMVVKAILEREKLLVRALDNELPGSPVPYCG